MNQQRAGRTGGILFLGLGLLLPLLTPPGIGASAQAVKPTAKDKCPVCGMFVAEFPDFLAQVVFQDGFRAYFDGPKDMFKFYLEPGKYLPNRKQADIASVYVTDYYGLEAIDGFTAFFVIGSDVSGPMGAELVPVASEREAQTFLKDHHGTSILKFKDVTLEIINRLD
jgi:nitrous oxide reductase accessory protein NosL